MRIAIFGDEWGLQQLLEAIPHQHICAVVTAENRPGAHIWLARRMTGSPEKMPHLIQPRFKSADYPQFVASLASHAPDLILVNSYSLILRSDVLDLTAQGAINIHGGILPASKNSPEIAAITWKLGNVVWKLGNLVGNFIYQLNSHTMYINYCLRQERNMELKTSDIEQ